MAGLIPFNHKSASPAALSTGFEDFYNMLDDFFSEGLLPRRNLARDTFKIDVEETSDEYRIQAELPGAKKEEINLSLNDGRLMISVNREENTEEQGKNYIHRERFLNSVSRSVYLSDAKPEGIKAKLENGILSVTVEKAVQADAAISIEIE